MANASLLKLLKGVVAKSGKTGARAGNYGINVTKGGLELGNATLNKADDLLLKALKKAMGPIRGSQKAQKLAQQEGMAELLTMLKRLNKPNVRKGAILGGGILAIKPSDDEYTEDTEIY